MTSVDIDTPVQSLPASRPRLARLLRFLRRYPGFCLGVTILAIVFTVTILAPLVAPGDPLAIQPSARLQAPSQAHIFGTDPFGRDVFRRVIWGGRTSFMVGISVAVIAVVFGLLIGLIAGYNRIADSILMRVMDGVMAVPGILLAIALVAATRPSVYTVIVAIAVPEIPRVARLARSIALSAREYVYVDAARAVGTRLPQMLWRHILPNTITPLIVQASFICASAILGEAYLSFLGLGIPPSIPTWGGVIAEGRSVVQIAFWVVLYPGIFLGATVLAINLVGDSLRDMLDPRLSRSL